MADSYTTIDNMTIISGTTVTCDKDIKGNVIRLNNTAKLDVGTSKIEMSGTIDVKCGGVYGYDNGSGKMKHSIDLPCQNINNATNKGKAVTVTLGPIKKTGMYRIANATVRLFNATDK